MASAESTSRRRFLVGAAALVASPHAAAAEDLVLSNAHILVGDGTELRGGVRIRDGRFVEVGPSVVGGLDMAGGVLYPGIYDAGTPLGLWEIDLEEATHDDQEGSESITPQARVTDAYNPASEVIPVARLGGVLGALVVPSTGTLVPGQAAWLRTAGGTVAEARLVDPAGVVFTLGDGSKGQTPGAPRSRMGVAMKIRDLFDANPPTDKPAGKPRKGAEPPKPPTGLGLAVQKVLRRDTKAIFVADRASDIEVALEIAAAYHLDAVILGGAEAHVVARALVDAKMPVLLGPVTVQPDSWNTFQSRYDNAARLHAAGVPFAFRSGAAHNDRTLTEEVGIAVSYGLPHAAAIAAMCGNGPAWWKLEVGQIKAGYEASLVWTDGDPLQQLTHVRGIWMRGVALPLVSRQTRLFERYKTLR